MNTSLIVANDMQARLTIRLHARHVISLFGEDDVHSYSSDPQEDKVLFNYFASERFYFRSPAFITMSLPLQLSYVTGKRSIYYRHETVPTEQMENGSGIKFAKWQHPTIGHGARFAAPGYYNTEVTNTGDR